MAEEKSSTTNPKESYPSFSLSNLTQSDLGLGLFGFPEKPLPPPPPCVEVDPSEEPPIALSNADPVVINESLTLYKGRVNTSDVFGVTNSDLVPGKYEGGLKLWEGSLDLVKTVYSEVEKGRLVLKGKRVLELGCGHGLPGIFTGREGAALIHFQDFNAEVLKYLTIPNVKENLMKDTSVSPFVRFFAGDWSEIHKLLLSGNIDQQKETDETLGSEYDGYDLILMAETVYALSSLSNLYVLIKKCLHYPRGVVYMAGKKHYFGVGGGTRQFVHLVEEDGAMEACLLAEVADGSSNVREVWKFSFK
ncbi:histidine protein methyltransferase 1 homolog [Ananas comosus]|uniref:protein-histidine N-methyltransferase n=1 Tax=Ananas comosus TaxID=4615 RepID=A0A6P5FMJ0_ANACO|nr:histidine protein methyltransferase 1 homolog [Ananas comosus]XP_020097521.1 histidine protein methyltransferase 1 homolog [Ananas comosus]XP_020097528.1 histidine protein methyltransferase 1 homolog [Ananas comosus]XP_020097540.1 histidine protein methyltransferase 1 homolog [Ananas comosus]